MNTVSDFLSSYFNQNGQSIQIEAEQASQFAKCVATDFNPIHDPDAKRFCVPGDLLFALVLSKYGLSSKMKFHFEGMVGKGVSLYLPEEISHEFVVQDDKGKAFLRVHHSGKTTTDSSAVEHFIRTYVAFSGHNFVDILAPLMLEKQVMINPARPLVIYESMSFNLERLDFNDVELALVNSELMVDGKRGDVTLNFQITNAEGPIGTGVKTLILSGLREYDEDGMQTMLDRYNARKAAHESL